MCSLSLIGFVAVLLRAAGRRRLSDAQIRRGSGPDEALAPHRAWPRMSRESPCSTTKPCALIWWVLLGVLLIGFARHGRLRSGHGRAVALRGADRRRSARIVINTVEPVWEGNQVWFILGGGAIFAAWPALYAVSFSGFYLAMFLVLAGADPAAGRLQVSQQDRRPALARASGTGRCSSAASCRR